MKNIQLLSLSVIVCLLSCFNSKAQNWQELAKGLPTPYAQDLPEQHFGKSVSIDGDYAVVGAKVHSKGIAYVLFFDGSSWVYKAKLNVTDQKDLDGFGQSVSISGNHIVVGAFRDDEGGSLAGAVYVYSKPSGGWTDTTQTAKLTTSDANSNDFFGYSVSISGDNIVAGAYNDVDSIHSGSAYVFIKPTAGWKDTTETAKLLPGDPTSQKRFGFAVDVSDDDIVIGAYFDGDLGTKSGSAYVFTKPLTGWTSMTHTAKLLASDGGSEFYFGTSVGISGKTIVVGAKEDNENGYRSGSAYVYTKPDSGWVDATQTAKILASDGAHSDYFGCAVSVSGDNIIVGAYDDDDGTNGSGSAYIFTKPSAGWTDTTQTAKLLADDGYFYDNFGFSVGISGDKVFVGANLDDDNGTDAGTAYSFTKPDTGWTNMTQNHKMLPPQFFGNIDDVFGNYVTIDGNYAVISAYGYKNLRGMAYVLSYDGANWVTLAQLTASDGADGDDFGEAVSISGDVIVLGSRYDDDNGSNSGSAYVFVKPTGGWLNMTETAKLKANDGASGDHFGDDVKISGDNIVVGASYDEHNGVRSGSAYIFTKPVSGWTDTTETAKIYASNSAASDYFGEKLDISGDVIAVGANGDDARGSGAGAVYIYTKPASGWVDMTESATLYDSDARSGKKFGWRLAIDGDNVVVGCQYDPVNRSWSGSAYVFTKPVTGWVDTTETAKLLPFYGHNSAYFGKSISIDGDIIVVGANGDNADGGTSGAIFVYKKPPNGWVDTTETVKIRPSDAFPGNQFGITTHVSGNYIVVGARGIEHGESSGSAYLYSFCDNDTTVINGGSTLTANQSGARYQWLDCNDNSNVIAGATGKSFSPLLNGSYAVEITIGTCVDTSNCETVSTVGAENPNNGSLTQLYPNPTAGIVYLTGIQGTTHFKIIDSFGQLMKKGSTSGVVDFTGYSAGLYTLVLNSKAYTVIKI